MRRLLLALVLCVAAVSARAQGANWVPVNATTAQHQVTASGSVNQITGSLLPTACTPCNGMLITVETANIRWTDDPTATPTTSYGQLLTAGQNYFYVGTVQNFKFIAVSGSPVLDLNFYQGPR